MLGMLDAMEIELIRSLNAHTARDCDCVASKSTILMNGLALWEFLSSHANGDIC